MTQAQYEALSAPFRAEKRKRALLFINRAVTLACYLAYPFLLSGLIFTRDSRALRALLVPGISFVLVSLIRSKLNFPRPYELLDIDPLIQKDTRGKSMPSRHVFSIFIIAMTFLRILPHIGILLLIAGALLACVRVIGGVHFPRDVLAGALSGIACGLIGFYLIP